MRVVKAVASPIRTPAPRRLSSSLTIAMLLAVLGCVTNNDAAQMRATSATTDESATQDAPLDDNIGDGVLIDFRSELAYDRPPLAAAKEARLLRLVRAAGAAKMSGETLKINSIENGAFSAPDASETAYLIVRANSAAPRGALLAVFAGSRLISVSDVNGDDHILRTSDLNADGIDELLLSDNRDGREASARLVEARGKSIRVIEDFGVLLRDSCRRFAPASGKNPATRADDDTRTEAVIDAGLVRYPPKATPPNGTFPVLSVEHYRAPCSSKLDGKRYPNAFEIVRSEKLSP